MKTKDFIEIKKSYTFTGVFFAGKLTENNTMSEGHRW